MAFDAQVMATAAKTTKGKHVGRVGYFKPVGCGGAKGQVGADEGKVVSKFAGASWLFYFLRELLHFGYRGSKAA